MEKDEAMRVEQKEQVNWRCSSARQCSGAEGKQCSGATAVQQCDVVQRGAP
jgi:hypothetical protein